MKYILTIFMLLALAWPVQAYDIGIAESGVTITERGNDITVRVMVELGTSGVTTFRKEVSASIDRKAVADWKLELRNQLKSKVLYINTKKLEEEALQSNAGSIKTWLEGQVNQ